MPFDDSALYTKSSHHRVVCVAGQQETFSRFANPLCNSPSLTETSLADDISSRRRQHAVMWHLKAFLLRRRNTETSKARRIEFRWLPYLVCRHGRVAWLWKSSEPRYAFCRLPGDVSWTHHSKVPPLRTLFGGLACLN